MPDLNKILVRESATIRETMACIDSGAKGIALVVDDQQRLVATLTDGDMRRAILAGRNLDSTVASLLEGLRAAGRLSPITARIATSRDSLVQLMSERSVRHIPLLDDEGRVCKVAVLDDLVEAAVGTDLPALIMAGGYGKRLMPLTADIPKPMLSVGDRPLIQRVVEQLRDAGIHRVNISTHHLADVISQHFGDGSAFGVQMEYVTEDRPLGTAGALSLLQLREPLLVVNGDILTKLDFRALREFHAEHNADMTVAVREYTFDVPYGVIETDGSNVIAVTEKPSMKFFVNAGIYLLSPTVREYVPNNEHFDMPQLIERLVAAGRTVVSFPVWEYWLDIGSQDDFEKAQRDVGPRIAGAQA